MVLVYLCQFLGSSPWSKSVLWQCQGICDHSKDLSLIKVEQFLDCTLHTEKCARLTVLIHTVDFTYEQGKEG